MPKTPHQRIASAGFPASEAQMLCALFDDIFAANDQTPEVAEAIIEALCTMARGGQRSAERLTVYADYRAKQVGKSDDYHPLMNPRP